MSENNLPIYLVPLLKDSEDLIAVLRKIEGGKRPRKYANYPELGCELGTKAAVTWAKGSAVKALTVAKSKSTQAVTLDELSKFTQKTVKRAVADHLNTSAETCQRLAKWAVKNDDRDTLDALAAEHHPTKWVEAAQEAYNALLDPDSDSDLFNAGNWLHNAALPFDKYMRNHLQDSQETVEFFKYLEERYDIRGDASYVFDKWVGRTVADHKSENELFCEEVIVGVFEGRAASMLTATMGCANTRGGQRDGKKVLFSDGFIKTLIASFEECSSYFDDVESYLRENYSPVYNRREGVFGGLEFSTEGVRLLIEANNAWSLSLAIQASFNSEDWTDEVLNELAIAHPNWFVSHVLHLRNYHRLSAETFSHLVMVTSVASWESCGRRDAFGGEGFLTKAIATVDPVTSFALSIKLDPRHTAEVLSVGKVPAWPSEFLLELNNENVTLVDPHHYRSNMLSAAETKPIPGRIYVNRLWSRTHNTGENAFRQTELPGHLVSRKIPEGAEPRQWVLNLMNEFGFVTANLTVNVGDPDFSYAGLNNPWVEGLHYWLEQYLAGNPDGWVTALGLLPNWGGTLKELGEVAQSLNEVSV